MADESTCFTSASDHDSSTTVTFSTDTGCNGAVNPAFEDTEGLKNSDSVNGNGGDSKIPEENNHSTNGELKSPTKDGLPPAEAVNLELVTMSPYTNSIPVKKESTELDMTDPYDEYFVPVNQHKKYIRGEKLYVTQDKRENLAGSKKKCCCGVIAVLVIGAAIAILVAVLLTQEHGGLTEGEARNYDKAGFGSNLIPTPPPRTSPSQPPPTTDMSQIYLKNLLEGELTIDNMGFTPGLSNSSSSEFNTLAISLEDEIKKALFDHQKLHYGASEISVKVIEFRPGSVIVTYRVGWRFREGNENPSDPINMEMLKTKLQKHLKENDGCLYNYRIPVSSVKSNQVIDNCQIDNNGCSKGCIFNGTTLRITCTCPFGWKLADDEKTCVEIDQLETHGFDFPHHIEPSSAPPMDSSPESEFDDHFWSSEKNDDSHKMQDHTEAPYEHSPEMSSVHPPLETSSEVDEELPHEHSLDNQPHLDQEHPIDSEYHLNHGDPQQEHSTELPSHDHPTEPIHEHSVEHHIEPEQHHPMETFDEHSPEPIANHSIESVEPAHEHPVEPSHEDPTNEDHSIHTVPPVVSTEELHEPTPEPSMNPIEHEHSLGYLPEPSMIPVQNEQDSIFEHEHSTPPKDPGSDEAEINKTEKDVVNLSDSMGLLPPILNENTTTEGHMSPEYLPEYSTFPDSPHDSHTTEHYVKPSSSESTPLEPHEALNKVEIIESANEENKPINSEASVTQDQASTTEGSKVETSSDEFPIRTYEPKEGEILLETNHPKNSTESESREELIDHMAKMDKAEPETSSLAPPPVELESKEPEKPLNFPEVVNDIHIEGNPFETETLNELPVSNEAVSEGKEHIYPDLHSTEKPIEHNVIETFREAKATDFTNSTSEETTGNTTHMGMMGDGHKSNELPVENSGESSGIESSSPSIPSDSAIFVTPAPEEEVKDHSVHSDESKEFITDSAKPETSDETPESMDHMHSEQAEKTTDTPSTEPPAVSHQINEASEEVKLVKTTEGEIKLPNVADHIAEIHQTMTSEEDKRDFTTIKPVEPSHITTMHPLVSVDSATLPVIEKQSIEQDDNPEPTIFVTHPPEVSTHSAENMTKSSSEEEMPMISVTKIPDLMGPFTVDTVIKHNPEVEKEQVSEKSTEAPNTRSDVYKLLDDESNNNLNSLEDDYDNDNLKSKYQKQGKSKLLKNFNVKEIYPHHNSSEKNDDTFHSMMSEHPVEVSSSTPGIESVNHLLSDEGYTTISPLFTSKAEPSSTPSSTTVKIDETTKEVKSDHGLLSSEAYNTLSPLFHSASTQATTQMKVEEITTTTPLIFDLIQGKKVDPKVNEFETVAATIQPDKEMEKPKEITTLPEVADLMSATTPASINPDSDMATEVPDSIKAEVKEDHTGLPDIMTTIVPDVNEKSTEQISLENNEKSPETDLEENDVKIPEPVLKEVSEMPSEPSSEEKPSDPILEEKNEKLTKTTVEENAEKPADPISEEKNEKITETATEEMGVTQSEPISEEKNETSPEPVLKESSEKPEPVTEEKMEKPAESTTDEPVTMAPTTMPSSSLSETATVKEVETTKPPSTEVPATELPGVTEVSSTEATHADIKDSVVKLLINSTAYHNSTLYSKCASGQWACLDGSKCIAPNSRCDSDKDCLDGSDEANCQEMNCPGNFQCATGECLKRSLVCDSTPNCPDGSDEINCESWTCNFDEMQCSPSSRKCIPSVWKCDNIPHCPNHEDEIGCEDSCANDEFLCPERWCIPLSKRCDGKPDCTKGEDEINCPAL